MTDDLLVKVSWWYCFDGLTQGQIASQLGISRASVGRLIDRAKNEGITRVRISPEYLSRFEICERVSRSSSDFVRWLWFQKSRTKVTPPMPKS